MVIYLPWIYMKLQCYGKHYQDRIQRYLQLETLILLFVDSPLASRIWPGKSGNSLKPLENIVTSSLKSIYIPLTQNLIGSAVREILRFVQTQDVNCNIDKQKFLYTYSIIHEVKRLQELIYHFTIYWPTVFREVLGLYLGSSGKRQCIRNLFTTRSMKAKIKIYRLKIFEKYMNNTSLYFYSRLNKSP